MVQRRGIGVSDKDKPDIQRRLGKQLNDHTPNPSWPNWGRDALDHGHAIFAIAAHLRTLGLSSWFDRLSAWLGRFDGFEKYVDDGCDPFICVRNVLAEFVMRPLGERPISLDAFEHHEPQSPLLERVVDAILSQEFLRYVAYWGRGLVHDDDARVWNPLRQPWMDFVESGTAEEELLVWRAYHLPIRPPLAQHRAALLAG